MAFAESIYSSVVMLETSILPRYHRYTLDVWCNKITTGFRRTQAFTSILMLRMLRIAKASKSLSFHGLSDIS